MKSVSRWSPLLLAAALACGSAAYAQDAAAPTSVTLDPDQMRVFLAKAEIVKTRRNNVGVTESLVATLSDGRVTHDAQIQTVDVARPLFEAGAKTEVNFRDSYKYNIAAYEVARLVGMDNVPMSVERRVSGTIAAVTWWLDDVLFNERGRTSKKIRSPNPVRLGQQVQVMRVFDELIQNVDRTQENLLWDKSWKLWLIDHTRAFRLGHELKKLSNLDQCERGLFEGLRRLTAEALSQAVARNLNRLEVEAVMARRDLLVRHFEDRIARRTEAAVLYTLAPPPDEGR